MVVSISCGERFDREKIFIHVKSLIIVVLLLSLVLLVLSLSVELEVEGTDVFPQLSLHTFGPPVLKIP